MGYDTQKVPNFRSPYRTPRIDHVSFGSCKGRFNDKTDLFGRHEYSHVSPGPGRYDPPGRSRVLGAALSESGRMQMPRTSTAEHVGPGSYGSIQTTEEDTQSIVEG